MIHSIKKDSLEKQKHFYSGKEIIFTSPEDLILKKLQWFKETEIDKHLDDALGILEIQQNLDLGHLKEWADKLHIRDLLDEILNKLKEKK